MDNPNSESPLILFQHGWAFSSNIWQPWVDELYNDFAILNAERGYFKEKSDDIALAEKLNANIAITHSLGLYMVPMNIFSRLKKLIILSGFEEFHPPALTERVNSERTMTKMLQNLDKNPRDVLHDYYRNCFFPDSQYVRIPDYLNKSKLFDDFTLFNKVKMRIKLLQGIPEILILHGGKDRMVSSFQAQILHKHLSNSQFEIHEDAGHMMFLSHQDWCMEKVRTVLEV